MTPEPDPTPDPDDPDDPPTPTIANMTVNLTNNLSNQQAFCVRAFDAGYNKLADYKSYIAGHGSDEYVIPQYINSIEVIRVEVYVADALPDFDYAGEFSYIEWRSGDYTGLAPPYVADAVVDAQYRGGAANQSWTYVE